MAQRLPHNLHHLAQGPALVPVFAEYELKASDGPREFNAMADRIAAELIEAGCEPKAAKIAGGSFVAFGFAPDYGLSDHGDQGAAIRGQQALDAWARAKVEAWNAAQARKAA